MCLNLVMREQELRGDRLRRSRRTTDSNHGFAVPKNIVARNFDVDVPNKIWAGDIIYVRTWEGWLLI